MSRVVQMRIRVTIKPDHNDYTRSARTVGTSVKEALSGLRDYGEITVTEPCELLRVEKWTSIRGILGADRVPNDVAKVLQRAINKVRQLEHYQDIDGWRALELVAGDFLAGPNWNPI